MEHTTSDMQGDSLRPGQASDDDQNTAAESGGTNPREGRIPAAALNPSGVAGWSTEVPDLPGWTAADYADHVTGSAAEKLADSGVAPLISAARGYLRVDESNFTDEMKKMEVRMNTEQGRRMKRTMNRPGRDGLQMPWYSVADIQIAHRDGTSPKPFTYQMRASHPELNKQDKPIKYEFISSAGTPLDLHPSTPISWIDTTPVVMFAEGLLKGDAALSAYLHANGVPYSELKSAGVADPAAKLRSLLDAIPDEDRILIIALAGVWNAKQNPVDWREVNLKDREGWIAFDADVDVNPFVHAAALDLYRRLEEKSKMKAVRVLSPKVVTGDDGSTSKEGLDDYLAKRGTWDQLLKFLGEMPPAPTKNAEEVAGNWRISSDGMSAEECIPVNEGPGGTVSNYKWEKRLDLGGRIVSFEARRHPTAEELRTGLFDPNVPTHEIEDAQVEIELAWRRHGNNHLATITGPESILNYTPADWDRRGASIPQSVLRHPAWPPRAAKGESWVSAIKSHRDEETVSKTRWLQMGWVPVEESEPVFLVGDQVIGDPSAAATALAGVDDRTIGVASSYGVGKVKGGDFDDPTYVEQVRQDLDNVLDAYIDSKAWTDDGTSCLVLAAALRPAIPLRPRSTVFLWGPKGKGKSWSAQAMMYFWARDKSDWQDRLPGSAKDTFAYIESAVACTPIWVIDDLAPSAVQRQAESENAKLADLVRAVFNNATKGRMNADMTSRKVNQPTAQLIITAENELSTPSAKERLIPAYIGPGKLNKSSDPTNRIDKMAQRDGTQARLTAHLINYLRHTAITSRGGWGEYVNTLSERRKQLEKAAETIMRANGAPAGSLKRTASLAADVLLTFVVLQEMSMYIGKDWEYARRFGIEELGWNIINMLNVAHTENQQAAPGRSLMRALTKMLSSGAAHIVSGDDAVRPPIEGTEESDTMSNHRMGWVAGNSDGSLRAAGPSIGTMITVKDKTSGEDRRVVIFDQDVAFKHAQATFPNMIQHGQGPAAAWASMWDEGFAAPYITRQRNRHGNLSTAYRVRFGSSRYSGVPVDVETILSGGMTSAELAAELEFDQEEDAA